MRKILYLAFVSIAISLSFIYTVIPQCLANRPACFGSGEIVAPFVYRVLPNILRPLYDSTVESVLWIDTWVQIAIVFVIIPLLYRWLKQSLADANVIHGINLFTVVWIIAQHYWFGSIGTIFEILFVVIALNLLNRTWLYLIPITALASLNRETAVLLVAIYAAYHGRKAWRETLVLLAVWVGITILLHVVIGSYPHELGLLGTLEYNLGNLSDAIVANLLLAPLAVMAAMGYKRARKAFKRFMGVTLVYVAAIGVGASWGETQRLVLPVIPLILPMMFENKN